MDGNVIVTTCAQTPDDSKIAAYPGMDTALFALLILLMVIYEPRGLYGVWFKVRTWLQLFPLYRKGMFRRTRTYLKTERQR